MRNCPREDQEGERKVKFKKKKKSPAWLPQESVSRINPTHSPLQGMCAWHGPLRSIANRPLPILVLHFSKFDENL